MQYIIEDNLNFKDLLNKELTNDVVQKSEELCLISNKPLDKYHIVLTCGHKFNYTPLYEYVYYNKQYIHYNSYRLKINEIKCPYCRNIQTTILPTIPNCIHKSGVNKPKVHQMVRSKCSYVYKSGKNKNTKCDKPCYFDQCDQHLKKSENKQNKIIDYNEICNYSSEMLNKYNMIELRTIAKYFKLKKYSKLKKNDLIKTIIDNIKCQTH